MWFYFMLAPSDLRCGGSYLCLRRVPFHQRSKNMQETCHTTVILIKCHLRLLHLIRHLMNGIRALTHKNVNKCATLFLILSLLLILSQLNMRPFRILATSQINKNNWALLEWAKGVPQGSILGSALFSVLYMIWVKAF